MWLLPKIFLNLVILTLWLVLNLGALAFFSISSFKTEQSASIGFLTIEQC